MYQYLPYLHNSPFANDIDFFKYETNNTTLVETCVKNYMKLELYYQFFLLLLFYHLKILLLYLLLN